MTLGDYSGLSVLKPQKTLDREACVRILRVVSDSPGGIGLAVPKHVLTPVRAFLPAHTQMEGNSVGVFRWVGAGNVLVRRKRESTFTLREHLLKFCQQLQANS